MDKNWYVTPNGRSLPKELLDAVKASVMDIVPALMPQCQYTAKQLCGPELWSRLSDGQKRLAGVCLGYLVSEEKVPLEATTPQHIYHRRYRLRSDRA